VRRREFITLAVRAQQTAMPVVGFLNGASSDGFGRNDKAGEVNGTPSGRFEPGLPASSEWD
jgi:hypothetical protein